MKSVPYMLASYDILRALFYHIMLLYEYKHDNFDSEI